MTHIENILCSEPQGVISFVGGGGKTSLMFHLARLLAMSGQRVLTTTTTKIFVPTPEQSETVLVESDPQTLLRLASSGLKYSGHITAASAHLAGSGKLKGFAPEDIDAFEQYALFDWILVEADGSAGRSLKAPADHEPVIPSKTTVLVAVAGLDVLGKPLSEESVFRSALAGKLMGLSEGETITESALARFFSQPSAPFKGAPPSSRRFIFLNKGDDSIRTASGTKIAELLRHLAVTAAEAVVIGQALERITVHSVHPLGPTR
ncbi:MAG: selenium cofactor biosynthesis protein YqeC [Desulfuromonadaceae bacterium]|nr:selenium cofactor biosynthesis protein YqeC [Desulfuromonadaceae bacterium]